jgi:AcrR family transcriptional regulator
MQERAAQTRQKLLDAAVDELVEHGYASLSSAGVARRAEVSRGAGQHHFPFKEQLVIEAVGELVTRQLAAVEGRPVTDLGQRLDQTLEAFSGPLFAAVLELRLAARDSEALAEAAASAERALGASLQAAGRRLVGGPDADQRWATAIATVRGFGILRLLGHSQASVERQWQSAREILLGFLA